MRTRIGRHLDVGRAASAFKRPGIDTRCWVSLAVALGDSFVDKDSKGVFVDITLMPTEEEYTARVAADYAGGGFGFYAKIKKDDELCVAIPSGDVAEGIVVLKRMWSAADLPPQQAIDDPEEVMLVLEDKKNFRIEMSGGGQMEIKAGENKVLVKETLIELGADQAVDKASLDSKVQIELTAIRNSLAALTTVFNAHIHITTATVGAGATPGIISPTATPGTAPAAVAATNSTLVTINS